MSVADFRFEDLALIAVTNAGKASMRPALCQPFASSQAAALS
jgi:hypothetical protein